jgi:hypothetical protein
MLERQREGIAKSKGEGRYRGRAPRASSPTKASPARRSPSAAQYRRRQRVPSTEGRLIASPTVAATPSWPRSMMAARGAPTGILARGRLVQRRIESASWPGARRYLSIFFIGQTPRCRATSKRSGKPCRSPAVLGHSVCRMHGARGGAPKGNKNAWRHGAFSAEAIETRGAIALLTKQARELARKGNITCSQLEKSLGSSPAVPRPPRAPRNCAGRVRYGSANLAQLRSGNPDIDKLISCFMVISGAAREIRTPDPIITNDVLYQLSYCGPVEN